jgi:hypothetical protein
VSRTDLLAVLAVLGQLVYPEFDAVSVIGRELMKESRVIQEFQEEARVEQARKYIVEVLEARFGRRAAAQFAPLLNKVTKTAPLDRLLRLTARSAMALILDGARRALAGRTPGSCSLPTSLSTPASKQWKTAAKWYGLHACQVAGMVAPRGPR